MMMYRDEDENLVREIEGWTITTVKQEAPRNHHVGWMSGSKMVTVWVVRNPEGEKIEKSGSLYDAKLIVNHHLKRAE
jgi:hypothetical protein